MSKENGIPRWVGELSEDDLRFIKRFILDSGSLKALAKEYDVSYPTLRIRLDRLIEKIKSIEDLKIKDPFRLRIQLMVADGEIASGTAKAILKEYEKSEKRR